MITIDDLVRGVYGAWRLIHFDRSAVRLFGETSDAFWKSFWAAAIVLPGELILRFLFLTAETTEPPAAGPLAVVVVFLIAYVIQWTAFPLAMTVIADMLNRGERFIPYIVAHNWSAVIRMAIILPAGAIFAIDGIGTSGWGAAVFFFAVLATWVYLWFIARAVLDVSGAAATFILLTNIVIALILSGISDHLLGRL